MCNQCAMFYSLYREYELKILCVSVKLAYLGVYFERKTYKMATYVTYSIVEIKTFQSVFQL